MPSSPQLQALTLAHATHRGEPWSALEIEFVQETVQWPADEVALTLGRTLQTVYTMRSLHAWTREKADPAIVTRRTSNLPEAPVVACGTCWTTHPAGVDCY